MVSPNHQTPDSRKSSGSAKTKTPEANAAAPRAMKKSDPVSDSAAATHASKIQQGVVLAAILVGLCYSLAPLASISGSRHVNKPYDNQTEFFSLYMKEHSNVVNRRLHYCGTSIVILYVLRNLDTLVALLIGGAAGYLTCGPVAGMSHGFVEFAVMLLVAAAAHKWIVGSYYRLVCVALIGYGFAWVGHFFHEHNKPATFIYPTFSLMSDFRMWYEMSAGVTPGLGPDFFSGLFDSVKMF